MIKAGKIDDLKLKIQVKKERQEELDLKSTMVKHEKNQTESRKLKAAYENMLVFEAERQREKLERQSINAQAEQTRLRGLAVNYQQAQMLREKEKDLQKARFFANQLAKLVAREDAKTKDVKVNNHLK